jgi:uncharacterized protein YndB with AHSA1/START domain
MKSKLSGYFFSALLALLGSSPKNCSFGQAFIHLGATPTYINISGGTNTTPVYLTVGGLFRTSGWITTHGEFDYVNWKNAGIGTYVIPFGYNTSDYLPFTFEKTAGVPADLIVSTWTAAVDNHPWADGVTNMYSHNAGKDEDADGAFTIGPDDGCCVIDRWWTIQTTGTANLTFSYRGAENTTDVTLGGPSGLFGAQRWNGVLWEPPIGSDAGVTSGVGTVTASGVSSFSPWVLAKINAPLPVHGIIPPAVDVITVYASEENIFIDILARQNSQYHIELYTALGQKLYARSIAVSAGKSHIRLAAVNLASAFYFVKVFNSQYTFTRKVHLR